MSFCKVSPHAVTECLRGKALARMRGGKPTVCFDSSSSKNLHILDEDDFYPLPYFQPYFKVTEGLNSSKNNKEDTKSSFFRPSENFAC